jgi:hypothetical protein
MPFSSFRSLCVGVLAALPLCLATAAAAQNDDRYSQNDYGDTQPQGQSQDRYDDRGSANDSRGSSGREDAYRPPADNYDRAPREEAREGNSRRDSFSNGRNDGYGEAYSPSREQRSNNDGGYPDPQSPGPGHPRYYEENEIVSAGHSFFGSVTKGLASAVEYAFKSEGRPNGYILGEDAGGAFMIGLRYGEGRLFTKDAGTHKVYWQGPSLGYDMGAEGSKTMVLVYNMHDPSDIYERFGGAEGSAYLVGGVSVQFQTYGHVKLGVIRSGVGLRLGANVGYSKYSRSPTWNPL